MNPVQYIIVKRNHGMSEGKLGAQIGHAAVEGVRISAKSPWGNPWDSTIVNRWYQGGHYAKIVLECENLAVTERYIRDRGFKTALIIDEGRTEVEPLTETAIGVEVLDKDMPHVRETFSQFKLLSTPRPKPELVIVQTKAKLSADTMADIRRAVDEGNMPYAQRLARGGPREPGRAEWERQFKEPVGKNEGGRFSRWWREFIWPT